MCGLCGYFTSADTVLNKGRKLQRARVMEGLLIANQSRGTDSTGIASIEYDGHYGILKVAENAWKFVNRDSVQKTLRRDAPMVIGHTRMTSMGNDVVDENAHPFLEGNIIGAHNGIINNYLQLDNSVRVDSQAVFRLLDKHSSALDYVFGRISGSCNLTWWDARDPEAMYLISHFNPLSGAFVESINTLFWSSESEHLESIMHAAYGLGVKMIDFKSNTVYRFDANDIWQWQEFPVAFASPTPQTYAYIENGKEKTFRYFDDENIFGNTVPVGVTSKGKGSSPNLPAVIQDDEDRYAQYWEDREKLLGQSDEDLSESVGVSARSIHDLSQDQFQVFNDAENDIMCGYCLEALSPEGGVYDSGLDMMLCNKCQQWWDNYSVGDKQTYQTHVQ